jgi:hypothetical protein
LNTKNTTTYADGYQGSCLGQTQRCGLIKPVNVIQTDIKVLAWDRHKDVARCEVVDLVVDNGGIVDHLFQTFFS